MNCGVHACPGEPILSIQGSMFRVFRLDLVATTAPECREAQTRLLVPDLHAEPVQEEIPSAKVPYVMSEISK